jgi:SAM-dependent methyltransferase
MQKTADSPWYVDWQDRKHASVFDGRHTLTDWQLVKNYESFNDVRMLSDHFGRSRAAALLEVGCATGEFYRYLRLQFPKIRYRGVDISQSAIDRALGKYPGAAFSLIRPDASLSDAFSGNGPRPEIVYSKDVVHHQVRPFEFLSQLLRLPSEALILRTRTRNRGATVDDPDLSCQFHYKGWMPFIVLNIDELIGTIKNQTPRAEIVVYRNPMVLGGRENRFIPKE